MVPYPFSTVSVLDLTHAKSDPPIYRNADSVPAPDTGFADTVEVIFFNFLLILVLLQDPVHPNFAPIVIEMLLCVLCNFCLQMHCTSIWN
jgi:hypothetical protein